MKNPHATKSRSFSSNRNVITFIIFITFLLLAIMLSYAQSNQRGADDIVNIPDVNLKAALLAIPELNSIDDGEITQSEASSFAGALNLGDLGITDPTGLEFFSSLTELNLRNNTLGSIDVGTNVSLIVLNLRNTGLTTIDVANLTQLTYLELELNDLTSLDISNNTALTDLLLQGNNLTSIDLSQNAALRSVRLHVNPLTSVDFSNNPNITSIILNQTNLTSLDVSNQPNLSYLSLRETQLTSIDLSSNLNLDNLNLQSNTVMTALDLSANANLRILSLLNSTGFQTVNLKNGNNENLESINFNGTSSLTCIAVDDVAYSAANWTFVHENNEFKAYCDPNDPVHFPDTNFKAALLGIGNLNTNDDNEISYAEAENYGLSINVNDLSISDLTGLEAFTNLIGFSAKNNSISEIDLSNNTELGTLVLDNNSLTSLDVSNNTKLTHLQVFSNALTSIDVSMLPELRKLWVKDNQLTSLNTSSNLLLNDLECGENQITSLDLSNNTALTTIQTHENNLTVLDVSNNPNLFRITAFYNDISSIDLSNNTALTSVNFEFNNLSEIDVSMLPILTSFKVRGNGENLVSVNLKNGNNSNFTGAVLLDQNPNLICIQVDDPAFSEANWTFVDEQTSFSTDCNVVEFADANFESALLSDNSINTDGDDFIQVSEATVLTLLDVSGKEISDLTGIQAFVNLTELYCDNNTLTSLDVSANTSLIKLYAYTNSLTSVALGQNTALVELLIDHNALTSLDVSNNTGLTRLRAGFNTLGGIDVSSNVNLNNLSIRSAGLTSLDISNNVSLTYLEMSTNELTSLDLSANILLENIFLNENQITTLDVSSNTSLLELEVGDNALESLNAANGNNQAITYFYTINNPNLGCITVDDPAYSETNWSNDVDDTVVFSTDCSNDATDIVTFSVDGMVGTATIDASNHTIEATVNSSVNLSAMEPTITISDGATISPVGPQDFTSSVTYTVAAEDNSTTQDWVVTLNVLPLSSKAISDVRVYPNPTRDVISIEGISDDFTWQILTISGKMLDKGKRQKTVDLSYYKSGLYIVQIQSQNGLNQTIRITKTN